MILDGEIAWDDIKTIGVEKTAPLLIGPEPLLDHLVSLKNGTSRFKSAADIAEVLNNSDHPPVDLGLAHAYGIDGMKRIPPNQRGEAFRIVRVLLSRDYTDEENFSIFEYTKNIGLYPTPEDVLAMYEAGVTAEDARNGMIEKLTANQIIAVHAGNINPAVSSGYL